MIFWGLRRDQTLLLEVVSGKQDFSKRTEAQTMTPPPQAIDFTFDPTVDLISDQYILHLSTFSNLLEDRSPF